MNKYPIDPNEKETPGSDDKNNPSPADENDDKNILNNTYHVAKVRRCSGQVRQIAQIL